MGFLKRLADRHVALYVQQINTEHNRKRNAQTARRRDVAGQQADDIELAVGLRSGIGALLFYIVEVSQAQPCAIYAALRGGIAGVLGGTRQEAFEALSVLLARSPFGALPSSDWDTRGQTQLVGIARELDHMYGLALYDMPA